MPLEELNTQQMGILLDFAERSRHLCFGRATRSKEAQIMAYKEWKDLARDLNYAGDGPWKNGKEWKQYWTELKNRTKGKVFIAKRRSKITGTFTMPKLTDWEQRIIDLANSPAKDAGVDGFSSSTDPISDTIEFIAIEPKYESTPHMSKNEKTAPKNATTAQPQMNGNRARVNTAKSVSYTNSSAAEKSTTNQRPPNPPAIFPPITSEQRTDSLSRLADSVLALARANQNIADSLNVLAQRRSK